MLDYETAINLLRKELPIRVRTSISASPRFENQDPKVVQAYQRLIDAHVIQCQTTSVGAVCEPGPCRHAYPERRDRSFHGGRPLGARRHRRHPAYRAPIVLLPTFA